MAIVPDLLADDKRLKSERVIAIKATS